MPKNRYEIWISYGGGTVVEDLGNFVIPDHMSPTNILSYFTLDEIRKSITEGDLNTLGSSYGLSGLKIYPGDGLGGPGIEFSDFQSAKLYIQGSYLPGPEFLLLPTTSWNTIGNDPSYIVNKYYVDTVMPVKTTVGSNAPYAAVSNVGDRWFNTITKQWYTLLSDPAFPTTSDKLWISDSRHNIHFGRSGSTSNSYIRLVDGVGSNQSGILLTYNAWVLSISVLTAQVETWTLEIRRNGNITPLYSFSINNTRGGSIIFPTSSLTSLLSAGDELQFYCNGTSVSNIQGYIILGWAVEPS